MFLPIVLQDVPQLTVAESEMSATAGMSFRAGYAMTKYGTWGMEFYVRQAGGKAEWIVRRSLMIDGGREQVRWLAEEDCTSIRGVMQALKTVAIGSFRISDDRSPVDISIADQQPDGSTAQDPLADAPLYTVWGLGRQPDASSAEYSISAVSGPVADWAGMAEKTLSPCWSKQNS